ncbi:horma domain protein [Cystoisospora suis]|uniref:Horma domain protein n=1 Tax=Cystoisospora suis TaxID=483139 RepID=A0A2C6KIY5_9APIC|nr:horma domain protein [Cystoisospora suis]
MSSAIATAELLAAFVEAAFHQLLCVRGVYPPQLFHRRRRFGQLVWQSHSKSLAGYLREVCLSIIEPLQHGILRCVALLIFGEAGELDERFVFQFRGSVSSRRQLFPRRRPKAGHTTAAEAGDFSAKIPQRERFRNTLPWAFGVSHLVSKFPDILARLEIVGCWLDGLREVDKDYNSVGEDPRQKAAEEGFSRPPSHRKKDSTARRGRSFKVIIEVDNASVNRLESSSLKGAAATAALNEGLHAVQRLRCSWLPLTASWLSGPLDVDVLSFRVASLDPPRVRPSFSGSSFDIQRVAACASSGSFSPAPAGHFGTEREAPRSSFLSVYAQVPSSLKKK